MIKTKTKREQVFPGREFGSRAIRIFFVLLFSRTSFLLADAPESGGPWLVQVDIDQSNFRDIVTELDEWVDVWDVNPEESNVVVLAYPQDYDQLNDAGEVTLLSVQEEEEAPWIVGSEQSGGIPRYPCYRTVEETYASAEKIAQNHPSLATIVKIGESWEKMQNPLRGYDILVLRLTQSQVRLSGEKPKLFLNCAIHSRELTTAELCIRFAEWLVANYRTDPDVKWNLDYHEVHINLVANPDGRKKAEEGMFWRKNTNNNHCTGYNGRGVDLNRNFAFAWRPSFNECGQTFPGFSRASEPEVAAIQNYLRFLFPKQREDDILSPAPLDATGIMLDVHSHGEDVLWSWGFTKEDPPNDKQLWTLARKYCHYTDYRPHSGSFSTVTGATKDFAYGDLGVPGFTIELGTTFFEDCPSFENKIFPDNVPALLYMLKVVRTPYMTPAGPEAHDVTVVDTVRGTVTVRAMVDDDRYGARNGIEPTQNVASALAFVDIPPWEPNSTPIQMMATDGQYDSKRERVEANIDTFSLLSGQHTVFVQGRDTDGNIGAVSAAFFEV